MLNFEFVRLEDKFSVQFHHYPQKNVNEHPPGKFQHRLLAFPLSIETHGAAF
ncbi:MAG TPA: hypothetical protein VMW72_25710 [Sedimentisphaerales bacterium]|nr:hypothetical protein [Sedimentisphaerales bacterium]